MERGLIEVSLRLRERPLSPPPTLESPQDGPTALARMIRWGPHPTLVATALHWFEGRPIERGLFAWDVLNQVLYGPREDALLSVLHEALEPVRPWLPRPGALGVDTQVRTSHCAVTDVAASPYRDMPDSLLAEGLSRNALGAVAELRRRVGKEGWALTPLPTALPLFASSLHLAGASTLASLYLDYLAQWTSQPGAWGPLLDVLLDVGAIDRLPGPEQLIELIGPGPETVDLLTYMGGRQQLLDGTAAAMLAKLEAVTAPEDPDRASAQAATFPRAQLVLADLQRLVGGFPIPDAVLAAIVAQNPDWRYAAEVQIAVAVSRPQVRSERVLELLDRALGRFGGRRTLFDVTLANREAPWFDAALDRLEAEVASAPYRGDLWSAVARHAARLSDDTEVVRMLAVHR